MPEHTTTQVLCEGAQDPGTGAARSPNGAALALGSVSKHYGSTCAVKSLDLVVEPGEFVTLLGPSGSGKTTTLNMIAGFTEPTAGEILMDGRRLSGVPMHKRNLGVVFQHYALFPHLTVAQNIAFPLRRRGVPKADVRRRVREALEMVRLQHKEDEYPRSLSGGQQQRVALARALVFEPRVLLMDEPLGALDRKLRDWLQLEIKRIHGELGVTVLYVTHDQEEALVLSDRIAVFNDGVIEQCDGASGLYHSPDSLFVAEFIGESNVFTGRACKNGPDWSLECPAYAFRAPEPPRVAHGEQGALVVRPERVRVTPAGAGRADGDNVLRGRVRRIIFLGAARRIELALEDGSTLFARDQGGSPMDIAEGDEAYAVWSAADSSLLPFPEGRSTGELGAR